MNEHQLSTSCRSVSHPKTPNPSSTARAFARRATSSSGVTVTFFIAPKVVERRASVNRACEQLSRWLRNRVRRSGGGARATAAPPEVVGLPVRMGRHRRSDVVVVHGAGDEASRGVFAPVVGGEGGEVAEDSGQRLALRPVAGQLGVEPGEAVGCLATLRRAPDSVEGMADEAAPELGVAEVAAAELRGSLQAGPVRPAGVEEVAVVADAEAAGELRVDAGAEVAAAFDVEPLEVELFLGGKSPPQVSLEVLGDEVIACRTDGVADGLLNGDCVRRGAVRGTAKEWGGGGALVPASAVNRGDTPEDAYQCLARPSEDARHCPTASWCVLNMESTRRPQPDVNLANTLS